MNQLERLMNLIPDLGTSKDDFAAHEEQKHYLGLDHPVDETREQLRLVRGEVVVARSQTVQTDGELDVARTDHVLDLEVRELSFEACVRRINDVVSLA